MGCRRKRGAARLGLCQKSLNRLVCHLPGVLRAQRYRGDHELHALALPLAIIRRHALLNTGPRNFPC